jgi:L-lactate dehydrogenase complex protein LldG
VSAREEILGRVRRAAHAAPAPSREADPEPRPAATRWEQRVARFTVRACGAAATVARVAAAGDVAEAVACYLDGLQLPLVVHLSAQPAGLAPGAPGRIRYAPGPMRPDGDTLVSGCFAAVADEGVIAMASGPGHASESAFLAATHVVVVRADQMLESLEALWARVRESDIPPRMLNLILGPSRTADLGVPSRLGAHGPLRVHVILVDEPRL